MLLGTAPAGMCPNSIPDPQPGSLELYPARSQGEFLNLAEESRVPTELSLDFNEGHRAVVVGQVRDQQPGCDLLPLAAVGHQPLPGREQEGQPEENPRHRGHHPGDGGIEQDGQEVAEEARGRPTPTASPIITGSRWVRRYAVAGGMIMNATIRMAPTAVIETRLIKR